MEESLDELRHAWEEAIVAQRSRLAAAFDGLIARASRDRAVLDRRPDSGGWSGAMVLEHVAVMHGFVFVLLEKIAGRTRARIERGDPWPTRAPRLDVVGDLGSAEREWPHPEHMTPVGAVSVEEAAERLGRDRDRLAAWLEEFGQGQGTLHRIRMSRVEGSGRLDLYQWVELVVVHAERHGRQVDRVIGMG